MGPPPRELSPDGPASQQSRSGRNLLVIGVIGILCGTCGVLLAQGNHASTGNALRSSDPSPTPTPIDPVKYKTSAKSIPYVQLDKDPYDLASTVVTYTGQVVQFDSTTGPSNLRISVTKDESGVWSPTDIIWLDVGDVDTSNVFRNTVIQFWGDVVGAYKYTTVTGAQITIPEVNARFIKLV